MPGILGIVDLGAPVEASASILRAMATRLRANDRLRIEIDPAPRAPAVLGRVHLGVLDHERAPAVLADGSCRAVLYGELSGAAGAAEVLAEYAAHGEWALRGLSGSFALALWDGRRRRCHLVNDRFGLRNVFFTADRRRLVFAPQLLAFGADPRFAPRLDPQATAEFLILQCVLGDRTLFAGVNLLPPASLLTFVPGRGVRLERTWTLRYRPRPAVALADHAHTIAGALRGSVDRQLDGVPRIALPLSGGLDSRTLLAAVPPGHPRLHTVTYGRPDADDIRLAGELARLAGTVHHTIVLPPGYMAEAAPTMVARTDGMHACLNGHAALLEEAAAFADLILLGNGGDCLLDGLWEGSEPVTDAELLRRLLIRLEIGLPRALAADLIAPTAPFAEAATRAAAGVAAALETVGGDGAADRSDAFNVMQRHRRWVLQGVPAQATSLEYRHPYYDDAVVAACLEVPAALRAGRRAHVAALNVLSARLAGVRRQGKPFAFSAPPWRCHLHHAGERVRQAIRWRANRAGLNPFITRPDRRGFADYHDELRRGSRALLEEVLLSPRTLERGHWRADRLRALVHAHVTGRTNQAHALGVVVTLELFTRRAFDGETLEKVSTEVAV